MNPKIQSTRTFLVLLALLTVAVAINSYLPQGNFISGMPASTIPKWQLALAGAAITAVLYGILGYLGLLMWRSLGFPDIWDSEITNRQRFVTPALVGGVLGIILIIGDLIFSQINDVGRMVHPPFPTSFVASLSAGIGEELIFRLFYISLWTWLFGKVILRGRGLDYVYWIVSIFSALAFSASHLPSLMIILGIKNISEFSPILLLEIFLLNSLISIAAAYFLRKVGFLGAVSVHFWNDIVWHMIWGLF